MSDVKSTPADRAAVLGPSWDGDGWHGGERPAPVDHVTAARELLAEAEKARPEQAALYLTAAQVHATLALAEATRV